MIVKLTDFINEEVYLDSVSKLRDSVHDIVITHIKKDFGRMKIDEVCAILATEYNINISVDVLHEILYSWENFSIKDRSIFTEKDKNWMDYWPTSKEISRKIKEKKAVFGKGRRKLDKAAPSTYTQGQVWSYKLGKWVDNKDLPLDDTTYGDTRYGGHYYGD